MMWNVYSKNMYGRLNDAGVMLILLFSFCQISQSLEQKVNNQLEQNNQIHIQHSTHVQSSKSAQIQEKTKQTKEGLGEIHIQNSNIKGAVQNQESRGPALNQKHIPDVKNGIDAKMSTSATGDAAEIQTPTGTDYIQPTDHLTSEEEHDAHPPPVDEVDQNTVIHESQEESPGSTPHFSRPCFPQDAPDFRPNTGGAAKPGGLDTQLTDEESDDAETISQHAQNADSTLDVPCEAEGQPKQDPTAQSPDHQNEKPVQPTPQDNIKDVSLNEETTPPPVPEQTIPTPIPEPPINEQNQGTQEPNVTEEESTEQLDENKDKPVKVEDLEMPSFDEWKQKMLAEQEKTKQTAQSSETPGSQVVNKVKPLKKNRLNTASQTCGAKVLAANTEAQNPASVLTENRDQYLINPCKAKKWFIIELCEPVQIQNLEIANFEMFSSTPEKFVVQISDRYPAKEWTALGTFHARDERAVQSFSVDPGDEYAKYVKVEMISHYGKEHYCPLSILRVYGTSVEEEWDDHPHTDEEVHGSPEEQEQPSSLFSNAKDTVLNLVKSVLTPEEEAENNGSFANTSYSVNGSQKLDNHSQPTKDDKQWKPLTPDVRSNEADDKSQELNQRQALPDTPEPNVNIPVSDSNDALDIELPSKRKTRQDDLVHLIETPVEPLKNILSDCLLCNTHSNSASKAVNNSICGYYLTMKNSCPLCICNEDKDVNLLGHSYLKGPRKQSSDNIVKDVVTEVQDDKVHLESSHLGDIKDAQVTVTPVLDITESDSVINTKPAFSAETGDRLSIDATPPPHIHTPPSVQTKSPNFVLIETRTDSALEPSAVIQTPVNSVLPSQNDTYSTPERENLKQSEGKGDFGFEVNGDENNHMGPDIAQIHPAESHGAEEKEEATSGSQSEEAKEKPVEHSLPENEKGQTDSQEPVQEKEDPTVAEPAQKEASSGMKDIYPNTPQTDSKEQEMDFAIPGEEQPGVRLSTRKETAYMRLNNRIKALELNLSLSSSYLEQLSQRYKRQMEDMYHSLNKTISKLTNMSKRAEERDSKQQDHIASLHRHIENLTVSMQGMYRNMHAMERQAIERHLCLMLIEAVVFILVLSFCIKRNQEKSKSMFNSVNVRGRSRSKSKVTSGQPRHHSVDPSRPRSSSSICIGQGQNVLDEPTPRLSGSETNLMIVKPLSPQKIFVDESEPARRKKKKKNKVSNSVSSANLRDLSKENQSGRGGFSSAGLLFGTTERLGSDSITGINQNNTAHSSSQEKTTKYNRFDMKAPQVRKNTYSNGLSSNINGNIVKERTLCANGKCNVNGHIISKHKEASWSGFFSRN